ncbi:ubiquitin-conjugating enzyme E2Q-like protein 1 [Hemicordylus capensis]|uniref:ubiquitin-conjugating enzyme E2Q-like protein 1 n=1 Tax=Hemicordylus capensis TaxID=884348 RepID=UPI0023047AFF|nr:ubiquitin-conjugating enzyme E2Q-like protein 1 [Hemicordylus capensis]
MATLLRKIGLIRIHNRDTEDPKHHHHHHHHHRGSIQQGSSLRGKSNQKNKQQQQQQQQGTPASGCGSPSKESCSSRGNSPARSKPRKVLELAKQPQQQQHHAGPDGAKEKAQQPLGGSKEAGLGKEQPSGGSGGRSNSALVPASLVPASRQAHCTQVRTRRLMKELQDIARLSDRFISVELVDESLFDWNVKLHQVDKDSVLWQDMKETNTEYILLNLTFPDNFPFAPPFMRVLSPRLENGYVLDGGAICMELLTPRGWSSAYTVEAVMRQFAASLVKGQGRICRKAGKSKKSFSRKEAEATFKSLVKTHEKYGWVTPPVSDG